ncbi:ATP-binding cassette domain-containing protein [Spiractinospora alimapuensis]|nr:ATP-binding cassette domain-containing protein [Spiractinospora alimapuensis]
MIEVSGLSKRFGDVKAVDGLSFDVRPGAVTGFLGPNGSGKSTTMRMILGLVKPDTGTATIGTRPYATLPSPTRTVGAVLDTARAHPAMTCADHLRLYARFGGHPPTAVDRAAGLTGVDSFADRRTRALSTGMRQRLALATALLGDPDVLLLDEPANGLDPQGLAWMRGFLTSLAAEGRTVLVSSHVLSELEQVIDQVVIIAAGRLVTAGPLSDVLASTSTDDGPATSLEQVFLALTTKDTAS